MAVSTPTLVSSAPGNGTTSATRTVTPSAGQTLYAFVVGFHATTAPVATDMTLSDNSSSPENHPWTPVGYSGYNTAVNPRQSIRVFKKLFVTSPGSITITAAVSGAAVTTLSVVPMTGNTKAPPVNIAYAQNAAGDPTLTLSPSPASTSVAIAVAGAQGTSAAFGAVAGWTELYDAAPTTNRRHVVAYDPPSPTATYNPTSTNTYTVGAIIEVAEEPTTGLIPADIAPRTFSAGSLSNVYLGVAAADREVFAAIITSDQTTTAITINGISVPAGNLAQYDIGSSRLILAWVTVPTGTTGTVTITGPTTAYLAGTFVKYGGADFDNYHHANGAVSTSLTLNTKANGFGLTFAVSATTSPMTFAGFTAKIFDYSMDGVAQVAVSSLNPTTDQTGMTVSATGASALIAISFPPASIGSATGTGAAAAVGANASAPPSVEFEYLTSIRADTGNNFVTQSVNIGAADPTLQIAVAYSGNLGADGVPATTSTLGGLTPDRVQVQTNGGSSTCFLIYQAQALSGSQLFDADSVGFAFGGHTFDFYRVLNAEPVLVDSSGDDLGGSGETNSIGATVTTVDGGGVIAAGAGYGGGALSLGPGTWEEHDGAHDFGNPISGFISTTGTSLAITIGDPDGHLLTMSAISFEPLPSSGPTYGSGAGASAGTGAATAVGAATKAAPGAAAGVGTATAVGAKIAAAAGAAAGTGTATGVAIEIRGAVGAASGTGSAAATGVSSSVSSATGAAAGTGASSGIGAPRAAAVGAAAGIGAATSVGNQIAAAVGSAAGVGGASAAATGTFPAAGTAAGVGAATSTSAPRAAAAGSAAGTGAASAVGTTAGSVSSAAGSAAGVGELTGIGREVRGSVGSAAGTGAATATATKTAAAAGSAAGTGAATAVGRQTAAAVGSATGTGAASGVGENAGSTASGAGAASGTGTATGAGAARQASVGAASGTGAANGYSSGTVAVVGSAAGIGAATATGRSFNAVVGAAPGTGAAAAVGNQIAAAVGNAAGTGAASASSSASAVVAAAGAASGTGDSSGVGAARASAAGIAAGVGSASSTGTGIRAAVGSAAGTSTATAVGTGVRPGVGAAAGVGNASAVGGKVAQAVAISDGFGVAIAVSSVIAGAMGEAAGQGDATAQSTAPVWIPPPARGIVADGNSRIITSDNEDRTIKTGGRWWNILTG